MSKNTLARSVFPMVVVLMTCLGGRASAQAVQPPWIFGMHDPGAESEMEARGRRGWIVFSENIGQDPGDRSGRDYSGVSSRGHGVIVRLNHGYGSAGTLPHESEYWRFAQRVANFIQYSRGADIWVLGNETNLPREWPDNVNGDASTGEAITPTRYVSCFSQVFAELQRRGLGNEILVPAPSGTWAPPYDGTIPSFPNRGVPGFLDYWVQVLNGLGPGRVRGLAIHAYTHGGNGTGPIDPNLVFSDEKMGAPYQDIYAHLRVYRNFMAAIPASMKTLPVWITESNELRDLSGYNWDTHPNTTQWVKNAYAEINSWNSSPSTQKIRALALFRWSDVWEGDRNFSVSGVWAAQQGFREALDNDYRWGSSSFRDTLLDLAARNQLIQFNLYAALQKAIFAGNFVPNSGEFRFGYGGTSYVGQRAEHLGSGEVRAYYVVDGDWGNVRYVVRGLQQPGLETEVMRLAEQNQLIQFNLYAALQQAIFAANFVPNSGEFRFTYGGTSYVGQRAEHLGSGEVRAYYVVDGDWGNVRYERR